MSKPYTVIVMLEAKPDQAETVKHLIGDIIPPSRSEKTCLEYRVHQDLSNPAKFVFYENWESQAAHALQFEKPYIIEFVERVTDLLAKPYEAIFAEALE